MLQEIIDAIVGKRYPQPLLGEWKTVAIVKDDAGKTSGAVDLGEHFAFLQVVIPTIDSAQLELQVAGSLDSTYRDLGQDALTVAGVGGYSDTWNLGGWRYVKIKASATQTTVTVIFQVRGITY